MKKTLLILVALLLTSIYSICNAQTVGEKNVKIEKGTSEEVSEIRPRIPYEVPITCIYSNASLFFTFGEDLGEVEITVTHQATGANATYRYDSVWGSAVVAASPDSGTYLIGI